MGRPKLDIDGKEVEKLASYGCTQNEIAAWFGCSQKTIERRFVDVIKKGMGRLKTSLRRAQVIKALDQNNTTMQIWLGKQILGQRERLDDGYGNLAAEHAQKVQSELARMDSSMPGKGVKKPEDE